MIKLLAESKEGRKTFLLAIDNGNLKRLKQDHPIKVDVGEYLPEFDFDLMIMWGKNMRALRRRLSKFTGPETKETLDLKALRHQDGEPPEPGALAALEKLSDEELAKVVQGVKEAEAKYIIGDGRHAQIQFLVDSGARIVDGPGGVG